MGMNKHYPTDGTTGERIGYMVAFVVSKLVDMALLFSLRAVLVTFIMICLVILDIISMYYLTLQNIVVVTAMVWVASMLFEITFNLERIDYGDKR